jgi:hypothetical protein
VIDLKCVGSAHGPGHCALTYASGQNLAPLPIKLLTVAQTADGFVRRENDGGREDGAKQGATTYLVDAGNAGETLGASLAFEFGLASHQ